MVSKEEHGLYKCYQSIDKTVVIQDIRVFNETPLSSKKCVKTITKILFYFCTGNSLDTREGIDLFFNLTKSFQSKHSYLKRLVYILLKELSKVSNDTLIAISSLTREVTGSSKSDASWYKAAALRALASVIQPSHASSADRIIAQSILDRDSCVSSAALASAYLLWPSCKEVVRRWSTEIQQQLNEESFSQYHALGLLFLVKQNDRISLLKVISGVLKGNSTTSALCLALRYYYLLVQEGGYSIQKELSSIDIGYFLRFKGKMEAVCFEAAKVILLLGEIDHASEELVTAAVRAMGLYLNSAKQVQKFAAIKLLNAFSKKYAAIVAKHCNSEIEPLITEANRSIATYAITTLLKTGNEQSIDRLVIQIDAFFGEMADEFKIVVVEAVYALCTKFPAKQVALVDFLLGILRQEGGFEFKNSAIGCIFDLLVSAETSNSSGALKEHIVASLGEYIEDCEFPNITIRVLHLLGDEVAALSTPSKFIRIIYNRLLLEAPLVRIAALSALFRIGMISKRLKAETKSLINHAIGDFDDEVRETALLYVGILEDSNSSPSPLMLLMQPENREKTLPLDQMEQELVSFLTSSSSKEHFPIDVEGLQLVDKTQVFGKETSSCSDETIGEFNGHSAALPTSGASANGEPCVEEKIFALEQVKALGARLTRSPHPIWLSEKETEFVVSCIKHMFEGVLVLEFIVKNTLEDTALLDATIELGCLDSQMEEKLAPIFSTVVPALIPGQEDSIFVAFEIDQSDLPIGASFSSLLVFFSKPYDGEQEFDAKDFGECSRDEYQVEDVEIYFGDFCTKHSIPDGSFEANWTGSLDEDGNSFQFEETLSLANVSSVQLAIDSILHIVGDYPVGGTEHSFGRDSKTHMLMISVADALDTSKYALIKCDLVFSDRNNMYAEVALRSSNEEFGATLMNHILGH